ncbi:MAG TPA: PadR family transcriptional regulator [Bryobacteraceae bacterium]|nr:PadR family transcriptional regulator [Bryobacteraceae bacterium]
MRGVANPPPCKFPARPLICRVSRREPTTTKSDLLQGTLDLLILKVVALGPIHGYGISQRIQQISKDVLQVQQGSLYPALHRLEKRGWLRADWGESDNGRQAKFYTLSAEGRKQLKIEQSNWNRLAGAVGLILETAE